jgi:DNA-binding response OmpR family regulator
LKPPSGPIATPPAPRILVVDDDRRVRELLEIALSAHGFRVITAADGEEAIQRALRDRPDLVVLDVRLPKRSGLDVCDQLRRDPEDAGVPIVLVSALAETESRLQAFARGADDYLSKPFSPKELVARVKRLLARSEESREARHRARELERELGRAQDELRRVHAEVSRAQRMRDLAFGIGRDLLRIPDVDDLGRRLLLATQARLAVPVVGLLVPEKPGATLLPLGVRGDGLERLAGIEIAPEGPLGLMLAGLGRPVRRAELERFPELREELSLFVAHGFVLLAPLRGVTGLEGVLAVDERDDGRDFPREDLEMLGALCDLAAAAFANAQRVRLVVDARFDLALQQGAGAEAEMAHETAMLAERVARVTLLDPRLRSLLRRAAALGAWGTDAAGQAYLEAAERDDPTGRVGELRRLLAWSVAPQPAENAGVEECRAAAILAVTRRYRVARAHGRSGEQAIEFALIEAGAALDPLTVEALREAVRESAQRAGAA